ncbi:TRAP transporter large permease [Fluviibacterium sp. DFM31]|uniref:TRAP transporter large permease protein n=1 Tax=Meridianimarinicoccus marinus TaxID=3231483 RepID=A0ABV3LBE2_9RHOB
MSMLAIGIVGLVAFVVLLALRMPIALAMLTVGLLGGLVVNGWSTTMFVTGGLPFSSVFPYGLSVVPLFVLMGSLALHTGMSRNLYDAGYAAFGQWQGGLSMGTIAACAGFGAICGSSLATAATMGRISIPEMRDRGYSDAFSAATVAAGGTLGVLIPPSIILVIYAILTEQSIGRLFIAAIIPGILATILYILAIAVTVRLKPGTAPVTQKPSAQERLHLALGAWPVLLVFTVVLGGLFAGFFSPTEAASVGVLGVALIAVFRRRLSLEVIVQAGRETAGLTGMIFLVLIGAAVFNYFVEATQITHVLVDWVSGAGFAPWQIIVGIILFYIVLGCFMDSVSMIFLTIPFVFPIVVEYGFDPIWFGILLLSVVEIGLITPPVGMNLFVVASSVPGLPTKRVYAAIVPFLMADCLRLALVASVPALSLLLVNLAYN